MGRTKHNFLFTGHEHAMQGVGYARSRPIMQGKLVLVEGTYDGLSYVRFILQHDMI